MEAEEARRLGLEAVGGWCGWSGGGRRREGGLQMLCGSLFTRARVTRQDDAMPATRQAPANKRHLATGVTRRVGYGRDGQTVSFI
jgi:hypothetical protein